MKMREGSPEHRTWTQLRARRLTANGTGDQRKSGCGHVVEALLLDKNGPCLTHAVNLYEVFYDFMHAADENAAPAAIADWGSMGLVVHENMDA